MKELLRPHRDGEHKLYARLRDWTDPHSAERREFFTALWQEYEPFAPRGFPKKLQIEFHQRWWEMYLFVALLHLGLDPKSPKKDKGPDVVLDVEGQQVFLEATVPSIGTKSDRVPDPIYNEVTDFPERECLLRLTQVLMDKRKKFDYYISSKVIPPDACAIIALSASDLNQFGTLLDSIHPAPLSILAGFGPKVITINGKRPPYPSRRSSLQRDSGGHVPAALFEDPEFSIVSGVLYSPIDLWNATSHPEKSLSLFVNPLANQPIPNTLQTRFECWTQKKKSSGNETVWNKLPITSDAG